MKKLNNVISLEYRNEIYNIITKKCGVFDIFAGLESGPYRMPKSRPSHLIGDVISKSNAKVCKFIISTLRTSSTLRNALHEKC